MPTPHEICAKPDGTVFRSIGPLDIFTQSNPRENKAGELYSRVSVGDKFNNITIFLKGKVGMCCLPERAQGITLTGTFTKSDWNGVTLNCEDMDIPEGSSVYEKGDVIGKKPDLTIKEALDVGMKAAEYMTAKMKKPELASAAFQVAAKAYLENIPVK